MPLVRRTRATLRRAEFGFFGVVVYTLVHTPRRCGEPLRAGVLTFVVLSCRPLRTSWLMVGNLKSFACLVDAPASVPVLLGMSGARPPRSGVSHRVLFPALPMAHPREGMGRGARQEVGEAVLVASRRKVRLLGLGLARHDDQDYRLAGGPSKS